MSARTDLEQFETEADRRIEMLSLWTMPLRSILSSLFLSVDNLFTGGRFTRKNMPRVQDGLALLSRVSYLVKFLKNAPLQIGADIDDARHI